MPTTITNRDSTTSRSLHDPSIAPSGSSAAAPSPEPARSLARVRDGNASQDANVSGPRLEATWSVALMLDGNVSQSADLSIPQNSVPRNERQRTASREATRSPALVRDSSASQSATVCVPRNDGYEISHNGGDWEECYSSDRNTDTANDSATTGIASSRRDDFFARASESQHGAEHSRNKHEPLDPATVYVYPGHPPPTPVMPPTSPPPKPHLPSSSSSSTPQPLAPMLSPQHLLLSSRHGLLTMKNNTPAPETAAAAAALPTPPATPVKKPRSMIAAKPFIIRDSPTGGMGAFATRDLHPGEVILEETPLFVADREGIFSAFARLSRKKQRKAMKLHASGHFKPGTEYLEAIWYTNSFATGRNREAGLFPIAARFNHACEPKNNVQFAYDERRRRLRFWVGADGGGGGVRAGEELRICYGTTKTPALLWQWYGFRCACGACEGLSDEEVDGFSVRW